MRVDHQANCRLSWQGERQALYRMLRIRMDGEVELRKPVRQTTRCLPRRGFFSKRKTCLTQARRCFRYDEWDWTGVFTFASMSPSRSKLSGSGIGPAMTHRLLSYLLRIKLSILLWLRALISTVSPEGVTRRNPEPKGKEVDMTQLIRWHVTRTKMSFPVGVRSPITPSLNVGHLLGCPSV